MFPISDSIPARRFPLVNILLIAATVFVFVQQIITPDPEAFVTAHALIPSHVHLNNYYSFIPFITAIFLHGGFLHIISNLWFLWIFGDNVEGYLGRVFYPVLYLLCGIAGNVLQYVLSPASSIPMLGASGAIAGVLGSYYILFPHSKIKTLIILGFVFVSEIPAAFMLGYWFVLQLISGAESVSSISTMGGVAFWAHVGGFVTGVVLTRLFHKEEEIIEP